MKLVQLTVENVKRVEAVDITPPADAPLLVIAGPNEAGKSSVLDAIMMALGGERTIPDEPVRKGASRGKVIADLGEIVVERRFTAAGGTSLVVTGTDGLKRPSPQSLLDGLYGKLSFDPLAFAEADPPEQAKILRALANLDTSAIEAERKTAFDERTIANRELTSLQARLTSTPKPPTPAPAPVDLATLATEIRIADDAWAYRQQELNVMRAAEFEFAAAKNRVTDAERAVEHYRKALAEAEQVLKSKQTAATLAEAEFADLKERYDSLPPLPDRDALRASYAEAATTNRAAVLANEYNALKTAVREKEKQVDALTTTINNCDVKKVHLLTSAAFPLPGLGLDGDGNVVWQGLPFAQASTAVRTRVSVAIGAALNPKLKVMLVRNGNDLDGKNLALLADIAREHGLQVWLERIAGGDGQPTVVIEDGTVAEVR